MAPNFSLLRRRLILGLGALARSAAAQRDGRVMVAADSDDLRQIVRGDRPHDADGELAVVR